MTKTLWVGPGRPRALRVVVLLLAAGACGQGEPPQSESADVSDSVPGNLVSLTEEQARNAGIALEPVVLRPSGGLLEATAEIVPAPDRFAQVGARVPGMVTNLTVAEGDIVVAGQTLATIDSPELGQATGDYLAAVSTAGVLRDIADREKQLFERRISSEREWRLAEVEAVQARARKEAAENRLHALGLTDEELNRLEVTGHFASDVSLRSPISGVVATRTASVGRIVQPGEGLFEIVDLREVAIDVDVYEQSVARVRPGQQVEVQSLSTGVKRFTGRVASVGAVVERQTRTVKVRVLLPNPDRVLRPGMFATVRVMGAGTEELASTATYVPAAAVQGDGAATIVFVSLGDRRFERREIEAGPTAGGFTLVLNGVVVGDTVVTTGSQTLKSEFRKGTLGEGE